MMAFGSFWIVVVLLALLTIPGNADEEVTSQDCPSSSASSVIIVKIGGSSITNKGAKETLNPEALQWFAQTIAVGRAEEKTADDECSHATSTSYIVVHGAGSFGHFQAKGYGLSSSKQLELTDPTRRRGVSQTRLSVQTLNRHVVETLIQHDIPAIGISPCFRSVPQPNNGGWKNNKDEELVDLIQHTLEAGLVPVLHGDVCLSNDGRAFIIGGDTWMEVLAPRIADRAVFVTDVDGIYTSDPRAYPEAELLRKITVDGDDGGVVLTGSTAALEATGSSHEHDVTGGLAAKLGASIEIAKRGVDVLIVKSQSASAEAVLRGATEYEKGTLVTASSSAEM